MRPIEAQSRAQMPSRSAAKASLGPSGGELVSLRATTLLAVEGARDAGEAELVEDMLSLMANGAVVGSSSADRGDACSA